MKDLVKICLYGDPNFKVSENWLILLATNKFIMDSNRFVKEDCQFRLRFFHVCLFYFVLKTIFKISPGLVTTISYCFRTV